MSDLGWLRSHPRLLRALFGGLLVTLLAGLAGLVFFLSGSLFLGLDVGLGRWTNLSLPSALFAHGPMGWAAWMALAMACGAPVLGAAAFVTLMLGDSNAG